MNKTKSTWLKPPNYRNGRSNKKVLTVYSTMVNGLAITVNDKPAAERLKTLKQRIDFRLADANGADISGFACVIFDDLIAVRDFDVDGSKSEFDAAIKLLEEDVEKMLSCIREGLTVTPWADDTDKRVVKFAAKVTALKSIYRRAHQDYEHMKRTHDEVVKELSVEHEEYAKIKLVSKERRTYAYCKSRGAALEVIADILDELDELMDTAKKSPSLAGRLSRLINVKRLGDFYANPQKAQCEREKLKGELLYITQSIEKGQTYGNDWASVLYSDSAAVLKMAAETTSITTTTVQTDAHETKSTENTNKKQLKGGTQL